MVKNPCALSIYKSIHNTTNKLIQSVFRLGANKTLAFQEHS